MHKAGRGTYFNNLTVASHPDSKLTIGSFCSIAPDVRVFLGDEHHTEWVSTYPFKGAIGHPTTKGDVVIGNDVWIGYGATIMSGVTIGDGAVIAARSHVVKNVKPYEIVGGNPAKHIRFRFDTETIELLARLQWWALPDKDITNIVSLLTSAPDKTALEELCKLHSHS